ncbi:hypothetical protein CERSUDRAFT_78857, partial [Gelatoporia subvermispora B]
MTPASDGLDRVVALHTATAQLEVLESSMLSGLWPLAFAPSTVLHNYISADLLVVGYPWLTLHGTGVSTGHANAEAVDRLRAMKIPHEDHPSKFEFVAEHTNGCLAPHYLCLCAPRFFGDN